jgi:hypothetical protein
MPRALTADERRLLTLAKAQQPEIESGAVADAWNVIIEAVTNAWLGVSGAYSLQNTITEISGGGAVSVEEYSIEASREEGERETVIVSHLADRFYAPRAEMIYELKRLLARYRGEAEPEAPQRGVAPAAAAPAAVEAEATDAELVDAEPAQTEADELTPAQAQATIVPLKLVPRPVETDDDRDNNSSNGNSKTAGSTVAAQLGRMIESFADRVRDSGAGAGTGDKSGPDIGGKPAGEPKPGLLDYIRAEFDKARAEQAAKQGLDTPSPAAEEAKAALDKVIDKARAVDRDQLAEAIHNVADWVKSPDGGAAAFDSFLSRLKTSLTAAFDKTGKPADSASAAGASPFKGVREAMERRIAEAKAKAKANDNLSREAADRRAGASEPEPEPEPEPEHDN